MKRTKKLKLKSTRFRYHPDEHADHVKMLAATDATDA
jgi:hypothetical protein